MPDINKVQVNFAWEDGGTGVQYYRTIRNKQLICIVDGAWHTATDDDTWFEPISPINTDVNQIEVVEEVD